MAGYVKWSIFPSLYVRVLLLLLAPKKDILAATASTKKLESHMHPIIIIMLLAALSFPVATTMSRKLYNLG